MFVYKFAYVYVQIALESDDLNIDFHSLTMLASSN